MNQERDRLRALCAQNTTDFAPEFREWLHANFHIWQAFVNEALKVRARGHQHYSARTIVEVLRHHSLIAESGGPWKIDNDRVPDMARMWALRYPSMDGMFALRKRPPRFDVLQQFANGPRIAGAYGEVLPA